MTLNLFFKTVKKAGNIFGSMESIAENLYKYLEAPFGESLISESLKGRRNLKLGDVSINEAEFLRFFQERTKSTWRDLQSEFAKIDEDGFIDGATNDRDKFYKSLFNLFCELHRLVPITLRHNLPEKPLLFGREPELGQIASMFETDNYIILTGIGGIGKSHVASAYAHVLNESGEWKIQRIICEDSDTLRDAIVKLQFDGMADKMIDSRKNGRISSMNIEESFRKRVIALKNYQQPTLIILDNLNRPFEPNDREDFQELIQCGEHVRVLITSRNALVHDKQRVLRIQPLNNDLLLDLYMYHRFEDHHTHESYLAEHRNILEKMFDLVEGHTLMITLLAKLPERCFLSENEIYARLNDGLNIPKENIHVKKDGIYFETTVKEIIKKLFDISLLSDDEKSIMRYMSIMPMEGIKPELFKEITKCSKNNIISLRDSNWIITNEETFKIRLHPLICETILSFEETRPTEEICKGVKDIIDNKVDDLIQDVHALQKINVNIAAKIYFPLIKNLCNCLKDEYKDNIMGLNRCVKVYLEMNTEDE